MHIPHNPKLAKELEFKIDPSSMESVKAYWRNPKSEINQIIFVQEEYQLEEVGAVIVDENFVETFSNLLFEGAVKIGAESLNDVKLEFQDSVIIVDTYGNDQYCDVLYLPPTYLVKIVPGRKYD